MKLKRKNKNTKKTAVQGGKDEQKVRRGPKSKSDNLDLEMLRRMCELGLVDAELAHVFGVAESTINEWKKKPEISESIKKGKAVADEKVEIALFHRAIGYSHPSEEIKVIDKKIERVQVIKQYPPDTAAAIFFLCNRKPQVWKNKQQNDGNFKFDVNLKDYGDNGGN
jgi:DNA-binding transcriptional regulator YiaG